MLGLLSVAALASCSIKDDLQPAEPARHFRAGMEQLLSDASTKAYSDESYHLFWNANDRISIFYGQTFNREFYFTGEDSDTAGGFDQVGPDPTGTAPTIQTGYNYAVYPYDQANDLSSQGALTVTVPAQQSFYNDELGIGARPLMVARAEGGLFMFKHIGAYIGVRLVGEDVSVKTISFQSNNMESLAGPASVTFDDGGLPALAFDSAQSSPGITMTLEDPVELDPVDAKVFWLNVPAIEMSAGYTLTVTDPDGGTFQKVREKELILERSYFYTLDAEVEITPAPLNESSYAKASSIAVGEKYLIVDADDQRVFTGAKAGSYETVSPVDGVITGETLAAYEFTVEQNGNNYYLRFNDGNYLVCDYGSNGDGSSGLRYVASPSSVTYPYALTVENGAFFFSTTQMSSTSERNQVLYYKPAAAGGTGPDRFKIGGSGTNYGGVHLYQKGGKQDRGLKFEPEEVICLEGQTPQKPELSGTYTTVRYSSDNTAVATVDGSGNVTVIGVGTTTITAEADEDTRYLAGMASYTLTVLDSSTASYVKAASITVGGTYVIVDVDDQRLFKGATDGSFLSVSPENGVIIDYDRTLSAYEFTVEQNGSNYYLKFNDGKYLVCDYGSSGDSTTGLRYVATQSAATYPYALTVKDGAFEFNTTQMTSTGSTNQVLYFKTTTMGNSGTNRFKIGGSGVGIGVHLYLKGGKQDRGLKFSPESVTCFQGNTPEKPELSGVYSTLSWKSDNTLVATVDANGNVTAKSAGTAIITASAAEDDDYIAGAASYTLTVLDPSSTSYTKVSTLTVDGTYLIVNIADNLVFKGAINGSSQSVTPTNGVIMDTNRTLSAYEFTVEQSGTNYYLKFNDGNYLVSDYNSPGNGTTGLRYVNSRSAVTYPYSLTTGNGAFMFSTTQMNSSSSTNQVLYYKTADNANVFKIGGSGREIGVHLYLKGGGNGSNTPAKKTQTIAFSAPTITWNLGQNYAVGQNYAIPQTATGAQTTVTYSSETPSVATVNNNRITIVAAGSATIKATAAETDEYYGATATYTLNITSPAPEGWVDLKSFNLENIVLSSYLDEAQANYTDTNEQEVTYASKYRNLYSSISRQDIPAPVTITWTNPASSNTFVTIYSDESLSSSVLSPVKATANATSVDVYNLVPGRKYYYTVSESGSIKEKGYFNTTGRRRMLRISATKSNDNANNCRDLGGMITKDGTKRIKYGYIFRGSNMDRTTADEKSILYNDLNIRLDVDLRASSGGWGSNIASNPFQNANDGHDYSAMSYLNKGFSSFNDLNSNPSRVKDVINSIMNSVLAGDAVYFHCYVGADRTGFFGLLIEGMLGISEADCSMDYELTSFSVVGLRGRDGSGEDHYWGSKNSPKGLALLRSQTGSSFEQKCTNYLVSIGVSQTQINQFKSFILESNN